jgi:hypothetical protein
MFTTDPISTWGEIDETGGADVQDTGANAELDLSIQNMCTGFVFFACITNQTKKK